MRNKEQVSIAMCYRSLIGIKLGCSGNKICGVCLGSGRQRSANGDRKSGNRGLASTMVELGLHTAYATQPSSKLTSGRSRLKGPPFRDASFSTSIHVVRSFEEPKGGYESAWLISWYRWYR